MHLLCLMLTHILHLLPELSLSHSLSLSLSHTHNPPLFHSATTSCPSPSILSAFILNTFSRTQISLSTPLCLPDYTVLLRYVYVYMYMHILCLHLRKDVSPPCAPPTRVYAYVCICTHRHSHLPFTSLWSIVPNKLAHRTPTHTPQPKHRAAA